MPQKPLFEYYIANIECQLVPQEVYWFEEYLFAFFPSSEENSLSAINHKTLGKQMLPCLGLLIYRPKGELTLNIVRKTLDDFTTCVCLLWPDSFLFSAVRDLQEMNLQTFSQLVKKTRNIAAVLERSIFRKNDLKTTFGGALTDYTKIVYGLQVNLQLNFFPIFQKFISLDRNGKDYQAIKLWIFTKFMHPLIGKFYDNANMRYSLFFTLLESFLPKQNKRKIYLCKVCGSERNSKVEMSVSERFSLYVDKLPISDELKERAKNTFECMRPIRNKFYHNAERESEFGNNKDIRMITGRNTMTYKEDLHLNGGREFGPNFMENFIKTILLTRLACESNFKEEAEFNSSLLWDYFKPMSVIGKVDVSFSSLVGYLHVGILDFVELEKRILRCKKDEICKGRKIRQFYFQNENTTSTIMVVIDTPSKFNRVGTEFNKELDWSKNKWTESLFKILSTLKIEDAYLTNLVKCGSQESFNKNDSSVRNCWQFMLMEIEFKNPKLILCVGKKVFEIMSKRKLPVPVEYVPHFNYRMIKKINSNRNENDSFVSSEEAIIYLWKKAIAKHVLN